jgi:hypothetical protein
VSFFIALTDGNNFFRKATLGEMYNQKIMSFKMRFFQADPPLDVMRLEVIRGFGFRGFELDL